MGDLTKAQRRALVALSQIPFGLSTSAIGTTTCKALWRRGLITGPRLPGGLNGYYDTKITDAGLSALAEKVQTK